MDRRAFLTSSIATSVTSAVAAALPWRVAHAQADWRTFELVTRVEIQRPSGVSRAWIPLPLAARTDWHRDQADGWSGNAGRAEVTRDPKYGAEMLYAEWSDATDAPYIEVTSRFSTLAGDRSVNPEGPATGARLSAQEVKFYTAPTELIPTGGIVKATADDIVKSARTDVEKARAIYDWVVDNSFRDPKVRGCGWGDIQTMLETKNMGGKCGDLNALFVGLARAAGVPARDVYGLRVASSAHGYRSLGVGSPNVTRAQHCRAEFFASGVGWVPVDPADVRKVVLEEPPGNLPMNDAKVLAARKRLFGGWEMNWLAYNMGHDIVLPNSRGPKLPYLMYPNGETGGERLDQLDPDKFKYTITARELKA